MRTMDWDKIENIIIEMPSGFKYRAWLENNQINSCRHEEHHNDYRDIEIIDEEWLKVDEIAEKHFSSND